jgi:hypothetical protein
MIASFFGKAFASWIQTVFVGLFRAINTALPELACIAVVLCAFGLMITGRHDVWLGRISLILCIAVFWRILAR